jgi:hypothetical protein
VTETGKHVVRRAKRKACALDAAFLTDSLRFPGRITDISLYGAFIDTLNPLPAKTPVELSLTLSGGTSVNTRGTVVWSQENMGMGIEFIDMVDESRSQIERIVGGLP